MRPFMLPRPHILKNHGHHGRNLSERHLITILLAKPLRLSRRPLVILLQTRHPTGGRLTKRSTASPLILASWVPNSAQGKPHPIAWYQDYAAGAVIKTGGPGPGVPGRSFYSSLGHNNSTWMDSTFMKHVMGGLTWTLASNTTRVASAM
ncbi:ThuA domain-containing protein [Rhizoctonia solani AG-1 IA]|uniref:ThuA domain-containing protein n=1 Tax=Thanatephorus cucumeris (strain AG1-IA) TaxID=983506 RepID=L8WF56_THACA|nr:ThuA domain-containing protein [Rhizoctonia solani AG-1 IA]